MLVTGAATRQSPGLDKNGTGAPPTRPGHRSSWGRCDGTPYNTALIRLMPIAEIPGLATVIPYPPVRDRNRGYSMTGMCSKRKPN